MWGVVATTNGDTVMKKFVTIVALASSLAGLTSIVPAMAAPRHQESQRGYELPVVGQGYYEGNREIRKDVQDRASSPYAGGA